jgi:hypothetical protein
MHNWKIKNLIIWISIVATITLFVIVLHQRSLLLNSRKQYTTASVYMPYVSRSYSLWSRKSHETRSDIQKTRFPVTMQVGNEVCVELRLYRGSAGGSPVYCYRAATQQLTRRFDDVE